MQHQRIGAVLLGAAMCLAAPSASARDQTADMTSWVAAWEAPPIGYEPQIQKALGRPYRNETARQLVRAGVSGKRLRLRLSNDLSDTAVTIGAASIARVDDDGNVVPGSIRPLTFHGVKQVRIPPHAPMLTDAVAMPAKAGEWFAVSIYYPEKAAPPAHAQMLDVVSGDATAAARLSDAKRVRAPGIVSELDISGAAKTRVLVAFGDSITEGAGTDPADAMSWPDQLGRMLAGDSAGKCWSVVNAGISGNRILRDGRGPNALSRFDRDVLSVPGVTHIVLLEGINDIGGVKDDPAKGDPVTAETLINAYRQFIARAHARDVKVIIGTILPYEGAAYGSERGEQVREAVNRWVRTHRDQFDGMIDFDKAMAEPGKPRVMRLAEQIGDHLHPNATGYGRMARAAAPVVTKDRCPAP
ncbi:SGNH/GDSL hydrolase family protein [Stakelama saccharophila]|uniref:SGNH/GDSL hydrolase family protein n=1 Tax=Stakelama saccharophila TaxID=3075605 RepID=A0ABZ0B9K7_9SPHN|nr:SGNH/GDSL hydrolase family protein [Stakelama sp. W311]WNO54074.1 SGNH/GDSL hydrolase family protein [Stakelama sp. W311]